MYKIKGGRAACQDHKPDLVAASLPLPSAHFPLPAVPPVPCPVALFVDGCFCRSRLGLPIEPGSWGPSETDAPRLRVLVSLSTLELLYLESVQDSCHVQGPDLQLDAEQV